jgi:hypothetical protein
LKIWLFLISIKDDSQKTFHHLWNKFSVSEDTFAMRNTLCDLTVTKTGNANWCVPSADVDTVPAAYSQHLMKTGINFCVKWEAVLLLKASGKPIRFSRF